MCPDVIGTQVGVTGDHRRRDLLAVLGVRRGEDDRFADARMRQEDIFDLVGRDLLAPAVDQFLQAAVELDVAVCRNRSAVARPEPAIAKLTGVGLLVIVYA